MVKGCTQRFAATALKMALLVVCACALEQVCYAQQLQQIQAVVDGVRSPQHAAQADAVLRQMPGVVMSRTDWNTRNLLLHTTQQGVLDQATLNSLLAPLGMSVRCHVRMPLGSSPFQHLDPRTCGTPPNPTR